MKKSDLIKILEQLEISKIVQVSIEYETYDSSPITEKLEYKGA